MISKFIPNNPNEIKNDVIGETKTVLQLMDESRLKVSILKETLGELTNNRDRLQAAEHELKKSIIDRTAHIDITADYKSCIENCNEVFFKTAQQTQNQNHLLIQGLKFCDDSYDKIEETLKVVEGKHSQNKEKYIVEKESYCCVLKKLKNDSEVGNVESSSKCIQIKDFKNSSRVLQEEIECKLLVINEKIQIDELMKDLEDIEIQMEQRIQLTTKLVYEKENSLGLIADAIENKSELNQSKEFEISKINYEENLKKLQGDESKYSNSESLLINLKGTLDEIDDKFDTLNKRMVDNDKEKVTDIKQLNILVDDYNKTLFQINFTISELDHEIDNQKIKLEDLNLRIDTVVGYMNRLNAKPKIDHQKIINVKEKILDEFKIRRDWVKDEIIRKQQCTNNEVTDIKKVIEELQSHLQKPQNDYENDKVEISRWASLKNKLSLEKDYKQAQIVAMEGRNKILTKDFEACKEFKLMPHMLSKKSVGSVGKSAIAGQRADNNIRIKSRKSISRNCWDSDSSIEAVDLANKMRMRKIRRIERESVGK